MKKKNTDKNTAYPVTRNPSVLNETGSPETAAELLNKFGTYEIQPTADTENEFPAIAQGLPDEKKRNRGKER